MSHALRFAKIEITRMPGVSSPGFSITDLIPSINILYGPNGIGKSTTAMAMRALLWPAEANPISIASASAAIGDRQYEIHVNANRRIVSGVSTALPDYAPAEARERYLLAFHDLLTSPDTPLAQHIMREAAGGYDVEAARKSLKYRSQASKSVSEQKAAEAASQALDEARRAQEKLRGDEDSLAVLQAKRDAARRKSADADVVSRAIEYQRLWNVEAEQVRALRRFPSAVRRVRAGDADAVKSCRCSQDEAQKALKDAWKNRRDVQLTKRKQNLPPSGMNRADLNDLTEMAQSIREGLKEQAETERAVYVAEGQEKRCLLRIAPEFRNAETSPLDPEALQTLAGFIRRRQVIDGRRAQIDAARHLWAGDDRGDRTADLQNAEHLLASWLSSPTANTPTAPSRLTGTGPLILALLAALIATLALATSGHAVWLVSLALLVASAIWAVWPKRTGPPIPDNRAVLEAQFRETRLAPPPAWNPDRVSDRLHEIRAEIGQAVVDHEKALRWQGFGSEIKDLDTAEAQFDADYGRFRTENGLSGANSLDSAVELHALCTHRTDWTRARDGLAESESHLAILNAQIDTLIARFNARIASFGAPPVSTGERAAAVIDDLRDRKSVWDTAISDLRQASRDAKSAVREIRSSRAEAKAIYNRLGITVGDTGRLESAVEDRKEFEQAVRAFREAKGARRGPKLALRREKPELLELPLEELQHLFDDAKFAATEAEQINDQIVQIGALIAEAKRGNRLEELYAGWQTSLDDLAAAREGEYGPVIGDLIAEHIARESEEQDRPEVFRCADEIFRKITKGAYKLDFDGGDPPAFRALDTLAGVPRTLDELSSGTRVQLLIAVRLAFIETQEANVMLPLVVDEALANSDDERAPAIIQALCEASKAGRQIFYLTAQQQEVFKWEAGCREHGQDCKIVDMALLRGAAQSAARPRLHSPDPLPIPRPLDGSLVGYAAILGAPAFDPEQPIGSVDICDLADCAETVYRLRCHGIDTWGRFEALSSVAASLLDPAVYAKIGANADILGVVGRRYRQGRPPKIAFSDIAKSGAVSEKFEEPIRELIGRESGDAARIVAVLESKGIGGFRQSQTDKLRGFLVDNGWILSDAPLTRDEILNDAVEAAKLYLERGVLDIADIRRLVDLLLLQGLASACPG